MRTDYSHAKIPTSLNSSTKEVWNGLFVLRAWLLMTSKADKFPLETERINHSNNTTLTLKPGNQNFRSALLRLVIIAGCDSTRILAGLSINSLDVLWLTRRLCTHTPSPDLKNRFVGFLKWVASQENSNSYRDAVLPFIDAVMQLLTRILRRHGIQVVNMPSANFCYQACWQ